MARLMFFNVPPAFEADDLIALVRDATGVEIDNVRIERAGVVAGGRAWASVESEEIAQRVSETLDRSTIEVGGSAPEPSSPPSEAEEGVALALRALAGKPRSYLLRVGVES